jgi:hypothetical protein
MLSKHGLRTIKDEDIPFIPEEKTVLRGPVHNGNYHFPKPGRAFCVQSQKETEPNFGTPSDGSIIEEKEPKEEDQGQMFGPVEQPRRKRRRRVLMRKRECELKLWHMRFGHLKGVERTIKKRGCKGLPDNFNLLAAEDDFCVSCLHGKQKKDDHGLSHRTPRVVGELFHVDMTIHDQESLGRSKYTLCCVEHKSKVDLPNFLHKKSEAGKYLNETILLFERQTERRVKIIQCDGALEFIAKGSDMYSWCAGRGMLVRNSSPDIQEENGIAELGNQRRGNTANTMRIAAQLPKSFRCEAERLAAIVDSYIIKSNEVITGHEILYGTKPDIDKIKPFGCHAYAWRSRRVRKKTKNPSKTRPCLYMGPAINAAGYRLYDPFAKKMIQQSNVLFDEYAFGIPYLAQRNSGHKKYMECRFDETDVLGDEDEWSDEASSSDEDESQRETLDSEDEVQPQRERAVSQESKESDKEEEQRDEDDDSRSSPQREFDVAVESEEEQEENETPPIVFLPEPESNMQPLNLPKPRTPSPEVRRSSRILIKELSEGTPGKHAFNVSTHESVSKDEFEAISLLTAFLAEGKSEAHITPKSHKQAQRSRQREEWHKAECREIYAHIVNGTYELVKMPEQGTDGKKHVLMKSLWRYRIKTQQNQITNYKARLCADGRYVVVSPDRAFAGTPLQTSINSVFALAAHYDVKVMSGDIPAAYVQAPIPEGDTIYYVTQPEGHVDSTNPSMVWRLRKCLYGIPISGNLWNATFSKFLIEIGMTRCKSDPAVFFMRDETGLIVMPVVVDDTLDISTSDTLRKFVHSKMIDKFKWKDLGECTWYLGCRVTQTHKEITIDQTAYLNEILEKFRNLRITNANVPADPKVKLIKGCKSTDFPYPEVVGSLIWLVKTRPDIAYAVSACSRHLSCHDESHDKAVLKILGYLQKNPNRGVGYSVNPNPNINAPIDVSMFADSSWADDVPTRKSSYGYFNLLNNGPLSWRSKLSPTVVTGTLSAEYFSNSEATREAMFLIELYIELGICPVLPIPVYTDNKSAQDYSKVQKVTQLSKHMQVKWHVTREQTENGNIEIIWVPTEKNWADIFTKALGPIKFNPIRDDVTRIVPR